MNQTTKPPQISKLIESGEASAEINQTLKHITEIWGKWGCSHSGLRVFFNVSASTVLRGIQEATFMSLAKRKVQSVLYFEAPTSSFTFYGLAESLEVHVKIFLSRCKASQILKPMMKSMLSSFSWFNGKFAQVSGRGEPSFDCADRRIWML